MTVDDDRPPFSFVTFEGPVAIGVPGELLVRLTPGKVVSARDLAG